MKKCKTKYCRGKLYAFQTHCSKCTMREWRKKNPIKAAFKQLQHRAKRRGKDFQLTYEQFRGWIYEHDLLFSPRGNSAHCISVDRKDVTKGYTIDNIQPLTVSENSKKWHYEERTRDPF